MYEDIFKDYVCVPGKRFAYNSTTETITYVPKELSHSKGAMALLHEIAHAKLGHKKYRYDLELLKMEQDAWDQAKKDAKNYKILINEEHIEECLHTYRKWVAKRATCPKCETFGLQQNNTLFKCINCEAEWKVNQRKDRRVMRRLISS
ncbi:MAG: hypothetical protein UU65_C0001G0031 [candidate division CPR2 bacterium GW2011_GWC1_41_48]|uniref:Uncharacterized protein n=1 Tax=candidate division CPR2 bacterium GW2011_GWC1_41_48 TaxID=1618344 RepID=A0A0G0YJD6_UNCC2|nr:MAG: hypothetical protein UT47_C0001G0031 [candidate division CPR2 bacterium GW2011_GWC2_39_35]KKR29471.1 MAG: hypothetical protein UT60_C0001G0007 [candidate division CPR2 bacterium GW2011_GWD2_39_7]KKR29696.1 MAG: hypothetical protein UT59_C0001G0005 [candidate division CPR2 bacterium GW2011_GWD1_39_7]KKS09626.1 MAG: hypothetical protein UU65_C0001G0031 [candidate division CPR2 bacterium GW2011_GWC1_41_48]OGB59481.1 MAG: hypothetical protein A2Y27_00815 [candidate division CPR2 bacterium G